MSVETNIRKAVETARNFITHHPRPAGSVVLGVIALPFVVAGWDGRDLPFDVPDSADIDTDCRGSMKMRRIREELRNPEVNYRGLMAAFQAIPAFNNASCNISDIRHSNLAGNEFWIEDQRFTVGGIAHELFAAKYNGPWDSGSAVAAYKRTAVSSRRDGAVV